MKIAQFGSDALRAQAKAVTKENVTSHTTKELIEKMRVLLADKKLGIGLAAPQVGVSKQIAIIELQKTALRDDSESVSLVIINPRITQVYGRKSQMWEGCISSGQGKAGLFAKVPRYKKIELEFMDEKAQKNTKIFEGLAAHVIQHEVDHLNGILFVDKVKDTRTFMTYSEYKKMKTRDQ